MKRLVYIFTALLLFSSCLKEEYIDNAYEEQLVVEGSIEQGGVAKVMLTLNMRIDEVLSEDTMRDRIVRYAKVMVSDGVDSEYLTCVTDVRYPTQFVYKGARIVGRVGGEYRLEIEYSGRKWWAVTTIPEPNELYDIRAEAVGEKMYRVKATIKPNADNLPYMIQCATSFTAKDAPVYFPPALFGIIERCDEERTITINRPLDYTKILEYSTLFLREEDVYIRFCTMPKFGYEYWSLWENCTLNSLNPVFPVDEEPPTNIHGGAAGIWLGYGVYYPRPVRPGFNPASSM